MNADPDVVAGSVQSAATLWAAVIGGLAAIAAAVLSALNAHRARLWTRREQWWTRFSWACENAVSATPRESELGLSVLAALIEVPWAGEEDNEMAIAVANVILSTRSTDEAVRSISNRRIGWWKR